MNSMKFSEAMSELDSKYVDEALSYKKKAKKPVWVKLGVLAACLAIVVAIGGILAPFSDNMLVSAYAYGTDEEIRNCRKITAAIASGKSPEIQ